MTPNAARIAELEAKSRKNILALTAAVAEIPIQHTPQPMLSRPDFFDPPNVGISSTTRCWEVKLLDQFGKPRDGFLSGPSTITEAARAANNCYKNWRIISLTPTLATQPPPGARPVPPEASEYGVLKAIHARRRR